MAGKYKIDDADGVLTIRFDDRPAIEDFRDAIDRVARTPNNALRLWDLSNVGIRLTAEELSHLATFGKSRDFPSSRVAILADDDLSFGLSRMYELLRESERDDTRVFRTRRECLDWLKPRD